jgi:hypothetical protein
MEIMETVREFQELVYEIIDKFNESNKCDDYKPKEPRISKILFDFPIWMNMLYTEILKRNNEKCLKKEVADGLNYWEKDVSKPEKAR